MSPITALKDTYLRNRTEKKKEIFFGFLQVERAYETNKVIESRKVRKLHK